MKKYLIILIFALVGCTASKYGTQTKKLTVTHVQKEGLKTTVYARTGYMVYMIARFSKSGNGSTG